MPIPDTEHRSLGAVLDRFFPERATVVRLAALRDQRFRELCEDLALALSELARFEVRPDSASRPEIPEYRTIIRELEAEISVYLANHFEALSVDADAVTNARNE